MLRAYYAHCINIYNTPQEQRDVDGTLLKLRVELDDALKSFERDCAEVEAWRSQVTANERFAVAAK